MDIQIIIIILLCRNEEVIICQKMKFLFEVSKKDEDYKRKKKQESLRYLVGH